MNKTKLARLMTAIIASSALLAGSALADETLSHKTDQSANNAGTKVDSSMKAARGYMDDGGITAKAKSALVNSAAIKSTDISVKTKEGVVTLSGFVASQEQAKQAVAVVEKVEGVKSVSDKLQVKDSKKEGHSMKGYVDDATVTTKIKAKFLADKGIPSSKIGVETTNGVVQLSGTVDQAAQAEHAESVAKSIEGVQSVKNDLTVKAP